MEQRMKSWMAVVVLFFIALFFFSPYLNYQQLPFAGDYTGSDLTELNLPLRFIAAEQMRQGRLPLWSDMLSNGFPLFAEGQAGVLYPLNALHYWLFPFLPGVIVGFVVHYFLAALFTYYLCREYGMSTAASLFAAIAFGFSGPLIFRIKHINLLNAAVWLPLAVLWTERLCTRLRGIGPAAWLSLVLVVQLFAGHPQVSFITVVFCALYALVRMMQLQGDARISWRLFFGRGLLAGMLAVGLAAVQLLPSYELSRISARGSMHDLAFATAFSYNPKHLLTFLNPYFFGNPAENTYALPTTEGGFWESSTYIGILPLVLMCLGFLFLTRKDRVVRAWLIVSALSFLFIISTHNPLFPYLWKYVPGMDLFRFHHRFLLPVVLGAAVIAGKGWDWAGMRVYASPRLQAALSRTAILRFAIPFLAIMATVIDLFMMSTRYVGSMPSAYAATSPEAASFVLPRAQEGRVYSVAWDRSWQAIYRGTGGWRTDAGIYGYHREVLPPNINALFGIPSVDDRAWQEGGQTVKWLSDFWAAYLPMVSRNESNEVRAFVYPPAFTKLWGMQNARFFLSFFTLQGPDLSLTKEISLPWLPAARVYENARALPRAWFAAARLSAATDQEALSLMARDEFDPHNTVLVVERGGAPQPPAALPAADARVAVETWDNGRITLRVDAPSAGDLVLSQTYYPGWEATVDGVSAPVIRANVAFQAVAVPQGVHTVELRFRPASFMMGSRVTIATLALLCLWLLWHEARRNIYIPRSRGAEGI